MGVDGSLVCPLVFKTSMSGEEPLGWVRFPHTPAKQSDHYIGPAGNLSSRALLFAAVRSRFALYAATCPEKYMNGLSIFETN